MTVNGQAHAPGEHIVEFLAGVTVEFKRFLGGIDGYDERLHFFAGEKYAEPFVLVDAAAFDESAASFAGYAHYFGVRVASGENG